MRSLLSTLCLLVMVSPSFGQSPSSGGKVAGGTTSGFMGNHRLFTVPDWVASHLSVGLVLGQEADFSGLDVSRGSQHLGSVHFQSDSPAGIEVRYQGAWARNLNWDLGTTLYRSQDISSFSGSAGHLNPALKPSFTPVLARADLQYKINQVVYVPVGLNSTIFNQAQKGSLSSMSMDPDWGFQFGVGAQINRNFLVELNYQQVSYFFSSRLAVPGSDDVTFQGRVHSEGMNFQGLFLF